MSKTGSAGQKRKKSYLIYLVLYTLVYAALFAFLYLLYAVQGRSLIHHTDAWRQHLLALNYYAQWMRGNLYHLFVEHSFQLQSWSFGLGYGADILTTLQYYAIGEPLTALSVLVPSRYMHIYFQALIVLRPFLAGLTFSWYVWNLLDGTRRKENQAAGTEELNVRRMLHVLTGAICYVFSGTMLYIGALHPYFVTPMIWLPLLLLGVERVLDLGGSLDAQKENGTRTRRPLLLILAMAMAGMSNFYFFYSLALITGLYALARMLMRQSASGLRIGRGSDWSGFISDGLHLLGAVAISLLLAGCILVPVLCQFQLDPRHGSSYAWNLFHDTSYYTELLRNLFSYVYHPEHDTELSLSVVCLMMLLVLWSRRGHHWMKAGALLITTFLCLSFMGNILNGFSYSSNRWSYAAELFLALMTVWMLEQPEEAEPDKRSILNMTVLAAVFSAAILATGQFDDRNVRMSLILLWVGVAVLAVVMMRRKILGSIVSPEAEQDIHILKDSAILLLAALSIIANMYCGYAEIPEDAKAEEAGQEGFVTEFLPPMTSEQYVASAKGSEATVMAEEFGRDNFYRYTGRDLVWNASLQEGVSSTQFCWSFANGVVSDYFQLLGVLDDQNFAYHALDDRMILNALAGVRYYSLAYDNDSERMYVPYGFDALGSYAAEPTEKEGIVPEHSGTTGTFQIYQNSLELPFGYTYTSQVSSETFAHLSMLERQEVMTQGVVLGDIPEADTLGSSAGEVEKNSQETTTLSLPETDPLMTLTPVAVGLQTASDNTVYDFDTLSFHVEEAGTSVYLTFDGLPNSETYLNLSNMAIDTGNSIVDLTFRLYGPDGTQKTEKTLRFQTPESQFYSGWEDFAINLGYFEDAAAAIEIVFPEAGTYHMEGIGVSCQPMEQVVTNLQNLKQVSMEAVDLHKNPISYANSEITGSITIPDETRRFLVLNLPYTPGWTAYDNGRKVELVKANGMFCGFVPENADGTVAGEHEIRLVYHTPGSLAGNLCSLAGLLILAGMAIYHRRRQHTGSV